MRKFAPLCRLFSIPQLQNWNWENSTFSLKWKSCALRKISRKITWYEQALIGRWWALRLSALYSCSNTLRDMHTTWNDNFKAWIFVCHLWQKEIQIECCGDNVLRFIHGLNVSSLTKKLKSRKTTKGKIMATRQRYALSIVIRWFLFWQYARKGYLSQVVLRWYSSSICMVPK